MTLATAAGAAPTGAFDAFPLAEQEDLTRLAQEEGISTDEAVDRFAWQNSFALAATAIEEAFPDAFSSAEVTSESPAVGTVTFAGPVPSGVDEFLSDVPGYVHVELVPGASKTSAEIDDAIIAAHGAVEATGQVGDLVSAYDHATDTVLVTAQPLTATATDSEMSGQAQEIEDSLPATAGRVSVTLDPRVGGQDEARYGGGRLEVKGQSYLECTAGFNVVNPSGTTGVATAGHCSNSLTHENTNGATEHSMTYKSGHVGQWGDFQWHTTSDTEPDDFYYDWGSRRDVSALANPVSSQRICRFGQKSGAHCSTVKDTSMCATINGVQACRLVEMNSHSASGGDSGGPWYYGGTAYGFHKGYVSCGFLWLSKCSIWSRVTYIDDALNVRVRH